MNAKPGDSIILTNFAATEGTVMLAVLFEEELSREFGDNFVKDAKNLSAAVGVDNVQLFASRYGVTCIHDVSEGGVLGALWEIGTASGYGIEIEKRKIPMLEETRRICSFLSIDPLKLISGGCMLMTTPNGEEVLKTLHQQNIKASIIGQVIFGKNCMMFDGDHCINITASKSDELVKAQKMKGMV